MIVMALVALGSWEALSLDARDTAILGPLPIPRRTLVRAQVTAVAIFAGGFAAALNVVPGVLAPLIRMSRLPIGGAEVLRYVAAHLTVTLAAGALGFVSVLAVREVLRAVMGPTLFPRASAPVQGGLVVLLATSLLLLPGVASGVDRRWVSAEQGLANPPLWFVGLHETLAGDGAGEGVGDPRSGGCPGPGVDRGIRGEDDRPLSPPPTDPSPARTDRAQGTWRRVRHRRRRMRVEQSAAAAADRRACTRPRPFAHSGCTPGAAGTRAGSSRQGGIRVHVADTGAQRPASRRHRSHLRCGVRGRGRDPERRKHRRSGNANDTARRIRNADMGARHPGGGLPLRDPRYRPTCGERRPSSSHSFGTTMRFSPV